MSESRHTKFGEGSVDPTERRRFPRVDLVFRVRYEPIGEAVTPAEVGVSRSRPGQAMGRDISLGGVSFRTTTPFEQGACLRLSFFFEEILGEIAALGKVVRRWTESNETIVAVRFTDIDPDECSILNHYIREYERDHPFYGV